MKVDTITVTNDFFNPGFIELKKSLIKHEVHHHVINVPWQGFFTKVDEARKFAENCDADYILFVDAHDVIFVGGLDDVKNKIKLFGDIDAIFSAEKAIWPTASVWPDPSLAEEYPEVDSQWRYLNSGTFLIRPELLIELVDSKPPTIGIDDQMYWAYHYLTNKERIVLDTNCEIFQTLAHDDGSSFGMVDGKFTNRETGSNPLVVHGNGLSFNQYNYSYLK